MVLELRRAAEITKGARMRTLEMPEMCEAISSNVLNAESIQFAQFLIIMQLFRTVKEYVPRKRRKKVLKEFFTIPEVQNWLN